MKYMNLSIEQLHEMLIRNEVTPLELVKESLELSKQDDNNSFEYICEKEAIDAVKKLDSSKKNNLLYGIPFVLKDNFCTKGIPTTASCNILKGYLPVFDSEVYSKLEEQGAILIGKTAMDELAMGGRGTNGHNGITYNPWDKTKTRIAGGSSSGSAAALAAGLIPFALFQGLRCGSSKSPKRKRASSRRQRLLSMVSSLMRPSLTPSRRLP